MENIFQVELIDLPPIIPILPPKIKYWRPSPQQRFILCCEKCLLLPIGVY